MAINTAPVLNQVATQSAMDFARSGEKSETWFSISADARSTLEKIKEEIGAKDDPKQGFDAMVSKLESYLQSVNDFLARSDLSTEQRRAFLDRFFGKMDKDADDKDAKSEDKEKVGALSTLVAALMAGDKEALKGILDDTDLDELGSFIEAATTEMGTWREKNGIKHQPDTFMDDFAKAMGGAREFMDSLGSDAHENLRRIRARNDEMLDQVYAKQRAKAKKEAS